ncbi:four-helix bundle copper-binding protein [Streptomyces sp. NPDC048566]|uniref:four-helix bundle copper-binding protein n=1 Tax=Streptomyces sp. NPDC048566 TaxID=3365569 RepID=UPI00371C462F
MTSTTSRQALVRFLEDRFACAQACSRCARSCALRASLMHPDGPEEQGLVRREGVLCAEVCEATVQILSRQTAQDEREVRAQLEWCRDVCLRCADVFDGFPGAEGSAKTCRECAQACSDFLAVL